MKKSRNAARHSTSNLSPPPLAKRHLAHSNAHSRVYFSTPPNAKPTDDYLVDHSIFFYLIDPSGAFRDAFGRSMSADEVIKKISEAARDFPVA